MLSIYIAVRNAPAAVECYCKAFDAKEVGPRLTDDEGRIAHTELKLGEQILMLSEENPAWGNLSPQALEGTTAHLHLTVEDAGQTFQTATDAGMRVLVPLADQFYGHRSGRLEDPFGHVWVVSQIIEEVSHEEMQRRFDEMLSG